MKKNEKNNNLQERLAAYLKLKKGLAFQRNSFALASHSILAASLPIAFVVSPNEVGAQIYHKTGVNFTASPGNNVISTLPVGPNTATIGKFHVRGKNSSGYFTIELYDAPGDQTSNVPNNFNAFIKRIPLTSTNFEIKDGNLNELDREYFVDGFCGPFHNNCDWGGGGTKEGFFGFRIGTNIGWARAQVNTAITPYQIKITEYAYTTGVNVTIKAGQTSFAPATPSVNVQAVTASSATIEGSGIPLKFTFTLSAPATTTVKFEINCGSAAAGDFTVQTGGTFNVTYGNTIANQGTIDIPMGGTTAELEIIPNSDAIIEDDETVAVKVLAP